MRKRAVIGVASLLLSAVSIVGMAVPGHAQSQKPGIENIKLSTVTWTAYPPLTPSCGQPNAITSYGSAYTNVFTIIGSAPHHPNQTIDLWTKRGIDPMSGETQSDANGNFQFDIPVPAGLANGGPQHNWREKFIIAPDNAPKVFAKDWVHVAPFACLTAQESGGRLTISYDGGGWDGAEFFLDSRHVSHSEDMTTTKTFSIACPGVGSHSVLIEARGRKVTLTLSVDSCS
jgi:hypothetical protein